MLGKKKLTQAQFIAYAGVLSALAIVLIFVEIPYPLIPYLKLDFSEVITLIAVAMNFWLAIVVAVIKAWLTFLVKPGAQFIGHFSMFVGSITVAVTYFLASKKFSKITSLVIMSAVFAIVMNATNFFIVDPFYMGSTFSETMSASGGFGPYLQYNLITYLPFNIAKMVLVSIVFYFLSNRLDKEQ